LKVNGMILSYEIRVKGHLDPTWSEWFDGMSIIHEDNGESLLVGKLTDQAALRGLLNQISDLGISLISVNPVADVPKDSYEATDDP
jgi:hypothetical protein